MQLTVAVYRVDGVRRLAVARLHRQQRVRCEPAADQLRPVHVRHSTAQVPRPSHVALRHLDDLHRLARLGAPLDAVDRRLAVHRREYTSAVR